ncbi:MAG: GNAT family N-acetyltransferase [Jannaschia sp.]
MGASMIHMRTAVEVRAAMRGDAPTIARLADMAGEGLPMHLWQGMTGPGDSALSVGTARAARDEGAFSWRNAHVAQWHGAPVGVVIDYDIDDPDTSTDVPPLLAPLLKLEALATGTRYVNVLAVLPQARRRGAATALLRHMIARTGRDVTLVVSSANRIARGFYVAEGFDDVARHAMRRGGPQGLAGDWLLMRRRSDLAAVQ